jgi:hypothetical protein
MNAHRAERARNIAGGFAFANGDVIAKSNSVLICPGEGRGNRSNEQESVGEEQSAHR